MIDLLNRPTEADRLRVLDILAKHKVAKKEHPFDEVECKTLATSAEIAEIAGTAQTSVCNYALQYPHIVAHKNGTQNILYRQAAIDLLRTLGVGIYGDNRFLATDIARAYRVGNNTIYRWIERHKDSLPDPDVLKSGRPAWSNELAQIVCAKFEERLR